MAAYTLPGTVGPIGTTLGGPLVAALGPLGTLLASALATIALGLITTAVLARTRARAVWSSHAVSRTLKPGHRAV